MEENIKENRQHMMNTGKDDRVYWLWHYGISFVIFGGVVAIFTAFII